MKLSETLPTTLEEAIAYFYEWFDDDSIKVELDKDEDSFSAYCHSQISGIGTYMRNHLKLWEKRTELYEHMMSIHNISHPEDISDLIIRGVHKKYKEDSTLFWRGIGMN